MKRITFIRPILHFWIIFSLFNCSGEHQTTQQASDTTPDKPNIIFIMADDLGYGDLGCYGQNLIQTPNIDQVAREGMRFTNCYAGSPVCAPSRSVLMTGMHTGHTTVRGNFGATGVVGLAGGEGRVPLKDSDVTIAEMLKKAGYVTGMSGKWGLGEPNTSGLPNDQGFDEFFGYLNQRRAHEYYADYLWHNTEKVELQGNENGQQQTYSHDLVTDFALAFIHDNKDKPFFLYIPYTIPHDEYEVPSLAPYEEKDWSELEKTYAAMVTRMDGDVGRIIDTLKQYQIDQNTILFFCSDNGAAKRWDSRFSSSGSLRGQKRDLYEGGIRTPMIVRYPGKIKSGTTEDTPWYFPDVMPTLGALANASVPDSLDGVNIAPLLFSQAYEQDNRYFYWEFHELGFQQAVRWKNWKYLKLGSGGDKNELYNLDTDPSEDHNIIQDHPDVVAQLEAYLQHARTKSIDWPIP